MASNQVRLLQSRSGQAVSHGAGKPHQQFHVYFANPQRDKKYVSNYSYSLLVAIAERAKVPSLLITSTVRNAQEQAEDMFKNLKKPMHYRAPGRSVLAVARADLKAGKSRTETIADMVRQIDAKGLASVTRHAYQQGMNTVDLSIKHFGKFDDELWAYSRVVHALVDAVRTGEVSGFGWPEAGLFGWPTGKYGRGRLFSDAACLHVEIPQPWIGDFPTQQSDGAGLA